LFQIDAKKYISGTGRERAPPRLYVSKRLISTVAAFCLLLSCISPSPTPVVFEREMRGIINYAIEKDTMTNKQTHKFFHERDEELSIDRQTVD